MQKVHGLESELESSCDWNTLSVNLALTKYFSNQGRIRQQKEGEMLGLSYALSKIQLVSI